VQEVAVPDVHLTGTFQATKAAISGASQRAILKKLFKGESLNVSASALTTTPVQ
jgi:hypothetical protein